MLMAKKKWIQCAQVDISEDMKENLFLAAGVYRWKGRLENAPIPFNAKHPVWIPCNHPIVELLTKDAHRNVLNNRQRETLNELRTNTISKITTEGQKLHP